MAVANPTVRRWTRDEYYRMADLGFFQDQRVELIDGEIIEMAPQKDAHAVAVSLTRDALAEAFGDGYWVRMQLPLRLAEGSDPEPDASVVHGKARDYLGKGHPTGALLVVEVSDTTLAYDRGPKASLYASAGITDYWIVNLINAQVEVHREPVEDADQPHGFRYRKVTALKAGASIRPLAKPAAEVAAADILP
jgi:Uma2 family endonuclease